MKTEKQIYQIKVVLAGSKPSIWRRILVSSDISLVKLHDVLQIAMGWEDCHLHQFKYQGKYYIIPDEEFDDIAEGWREYYMEAIMNFFNPNF